MVPPRPPHVSPRRHSSSSRDNTGQAQWGTVLPRLHLPLSLSPPLEPSLASTARPPPRTGSRARTREPKPKSASHISSPGIVVLAPVPEPAPVTPHRRHPRTRGPKPAAAHSHQARDHRRTRHCHRDQRSTSPPPPPSPAIHKQQTTMEPQTSIPAPAPTPIPSIAATLLPPPPPSPPPPSPPPSSPPPKAGSNSKNEGMATFNPPPQSYSQLPHRHQSAARAASQLPFRENRRSTPYAQMAIKPEHARTDLYAGVPPAAIAAAAAGPRLRPQPRGSPSSPTTTVRSSGGEKAGPKVLHLRLIAVVILREDHGGLVAGILRLGPGLGSISPDPFSKAPAGRLL